MNVFQLWGEISINRAAAESDIKAVANTAQTHSGAIESSFKRVALAIVGAFSIGKLVSEFKGFLKDAVQAASEYGDSVAELATKIDPDQAGGVGEAMRKLSLQVPITTADLMKVADAAAQMGMDTAPEIEAFVTSVAKISIATGALPEQVGQDFAKISKILADSELDFEGFGSAISALTDTHNINFEDLVTNTKKVADNFSGMATTAPEIAALVASFTEISGTAREAASQLQGVVDAMRDPSKIEDFAVALGLTTEQFESMRDNDFVGLLGQIATKLGDGSANADTLKDLLGESANKVEILGKNWGDVESSVHLANMEYETAGDLQEDFNIKVETFGSGVKILQNNVEDMKTAVGENLVPSMQALVDVFTENKQGIEDFFTSLATGLANSFVWIIENKDAVIMGIVAIVAAFAAMKLEGVISNLGKIAAAFDPIKLATLAIGAGIGLFATRIIQSRQEAEKLRQHMEAVARAEQEAADQAEKEAQYREWITSQTVNLAPIRQQTAQIISAHEVEDVAGSTYGEMFSTDYRYLDYTKANADTAAVADRVTELVGKVRELGLSTGAAAALIADLQGAATAALTSPEGGGLASFNDMASQIVAAYDEVIPGVAGMIDEAAPTVAKATTSWAKFAEKLGLVIRKTDEAGNEMIELGETGQIVADTFTDIVGGSINEYLNQADEYQAALDLIKEQEQTAVDEAATRRDEELAALQAQLDAKLISEEDYNTQHQAILDAYTEAETTAHETASQSLEDEKTAYEETRKSIWEVLKQMTKDVLTSLRESLFLKAAAAAGEALALGFAAIFDPLLWPAVGAKLAESGAYFATATGLAVAGFEKGGIVKAGNPVYGVVGEGATDEAVIPLDDANLGKLGTAIAKQVPPGWLPGEENRTPPGGYGPFDVPEGTYGNYAITPYYGTAEEGGTTTVTKVRNDIVKSSAAAAGLITETYDERGAGGLSPDALADLERQRRIWLLEKAKQLSVLERNGELFSGDYMRQAEWTRLITQAEGAVNQAGYGVETANVTQGSYKQSVAWEELEEQVEKAIGSTDDLAARNDQAVEEFGALGEEYKGMYDKLDTAREKDWLSDEQYYAQKRELLASYKQEVDGLMSEFEAEKAAINTKRDTYVEEQMGTLTESMVEVPGLGWTYQDNIVPYEAGPMYEDEVEVPGLGYVPIDDVLLNTKRLELQRKRIEAEAAVIPEKEEKTVLQQLGEQAKKVFNFLTFGLFDPLGTYEPAYNMETGYAAGAVFPSPTRLSNALVGEAGPEAFLPLNHSTFSQIGAGIVTAMSAQPALAGGIQVDMRGLYDGASIYVRDDLDIKKIARETYNLYATRLRSAGATI